MLSVLLFLLLLVLTVVTKTTLALPGGFGDESVYRALPYPTDMAFLPDHSLLVAQKEGILTLLTPNQDFVYGAPVTALDISSRVCTASEQGLISVQVHPDFGTKNRFVYLYYVYNKSGGDDDDDNCKDPAEGQGPVNRLTRWVMLDSGTLENEEVFFETQRLTKGIHTGGKIEFGNDGLLYIPIGDAGYENDFIGQNPANLLGSMIRLTDNGEIPSDNPFVSDPNSVRCNETGVTLLDNSTCQELYGIGLRNPFRMAMNPNVGDDRVHYYINDVGGSWWEEISEGGDGFAGDNYGYPIREGPCERWTDTDCDNNIEGFNHPVHYYRHTGRLGASNAITGGAFVPNGIWPADYDGVYLYSDLVLDEMYAMRDGMEPECLACSPARSGKNITLFHSYESIIAMRFGPYVGDTLALYYTASNGDVRRIFFGSGPKAVVEVTNTAIQEGGSVTFSAAQSTDPDDDALSFEWDFDGNGTVDSTAVEDSFVYNVAGIYEARLIVRDANGGVGKATVKINVLPPATDDNVMGGTPFELLPWASGPDCPEGYNFCGVLEFCQRENDDKVFGYRLLCLEEECECTDAFAPLIRLEPDNKYLLTLRNAGKDVTNLHTHGLHIVGDGNSDDILREVSGGGNCLDYEWDIAAEHPGGTYFYHAHLHGQAERQVGGGAYGLLIVEDNKELNPTLPLWAENELLLQIVLTPMGILGNGMEQEIINIAADQWYRLRVSIVSTDAASSNFTFADEGTCEIHRVAADGIWRSQIPGPAASSFEMTGVSRADFAIRCSTPGSLVPIYFMNEFAATLRVGDPEPNPHVMEEWEPNRPNSLSDLSNLTVPEVNKLTVTLGYDHVNTLKWNPEEPMATIGFNQVHEWRLVGTDFHPFHIHLYHMQVVSPGGCGMHEEGEFYDVVSAEEDCLVRFKTADIGQRCVLHCHVLFHEDNGSMSWVNVTGPDMPMNKVQSMEYSCPTNSLTFAPTTAPTSSPPSATTNPTPSPTGGIDTTESPPSNPASPSPAPASSSAVVLSKPHPVLAMMIVCWFYALLS